MDNRDSSDFSRLVEDTKVALDSGAELFHWWKRKEQAGELGKFEIRRPHEACEVSAFYDQVELDGRRTSVMGCQQTAHYRRTAGSSGMSSGFEAFLKARFLELCRWVNPDGLPGGFGYRPLLQQWKEGARVEGFPDDSPLDLAEIGKSLDWVVCRVDIHDFVRTFPGLRSRARTFSKFVREAAYVVFDPVFFSQAAPLAEDALAECVFGYSFLPSLVEPNHFGFGPGRFGTAIKQFQFVLREEGRIDIRTSFLVAPRSERVLYFGGFDPVYSAVHLVNALTFNLFEIRRRVHDSLDAFMLSHHARVHQALLDGMRGVWEELPWTMPSRDETSVGA